MYILSVPSLSNSAPKKAFIFVVGFDFQETWLCCLTWCSGQLNKGLGTGFSCQGKSGMVPTFETEITWKSLCIWSQSLCRFLIDAVSSRAQSCYKLRARSISCRGTSRNRYNQIVYCNGFWLPYTLQQWLASTAFRSFCRWFMVIRFHHDFASYESQAGDTQGCLQAKALKILRPAWRFGKCWSWGKGGNVWPFSLLIDEQMAQGWALARFAMGFYRFRVGQLFFPSKS